MAQHSHMNTQPHVHVYLASCPWCWKVHVVYACAESGASAWGGVGGGGLRHVRALICFSDSSSSACSACAQLQSPPARRSDIDVALFDEAQSGALPPPRLTHGGTLL